MFFIQNVFARTDEKYIFLCSIYLLKYPSNSVNKIVCLSRERGFVFVLFGGFLFICLFLKYILIHNDFEKKKKKDEKNVLL